MAKDTGNIIIIKRIKKAAHGHHGGAWKVAYADFVTAMMAFFLLLWLLNVTTDIERKGIADYFAPASISKSESGAGGTFGGQTVAAPGAQLSDTSQPGANKLMPEPSENEDSPPSASTAGDKGGEAAAIAPLQKAKPADLPPDKMDDKALNEAKKQEEESFKKAEDSLRQAIKSSPEMASLEENLLIDSTPEGLRIQIVDKNGYSLFASGNAHLVGRGRELVTMVGKVVARLSNKITVAGHTDSTPYRGLSRSNNWELSSGRAYTSLVAMMQGGVTENRVSGIIGKADREPLIADDPKSPQNRRISIVLLRRYGNEAKADAEKGDAGASPPAAPASPLHPAADFSNTYPQAPAAPLPTSTQ